jgi:hypothetical protein
MDKTPFKSAFQFTAIAIATGPTGGSTQVATTADTGAGINCISPELVAKLQLVEEQMDQKEEVQFANQETLVLDKYVRVKIQIGKEYSREILLAVCPVGDQILLGTPWWDSIKVVELTTRLGRFSFQTEAFPQATFFLKKVFSFPFATAGDILSLNKKQPPPTIHQITSKMVSRMTRNHKNQIFQVDLKAVLEGESQPVVIPPPTEDDYITEWYNTGVSANIKRIVTEFKDRFQAPTELPPDRPEDMEIQLVAGATAPKVQGLRRMNENELKQLQSTLKTLLERKQIRPSTSEFASQILFVKKPDGSLRLCIDYRNLNAITVRNRCPIPNIHDLRAQVRGKKYMTKFDLRDGYYNVKMAKDSVKYSAFKCALGLFEWAVLPFGLTNAPAVFQRMMNRIFGDLFGICVIVYLDDIVVFSANKEQHIKDVSEVLTRMRDHKLHIKLSKCDFFKEEVCFCGHDISGDGVKISESKVKALQNPPPFRSQRDVMKFLGVVVWFQDFVPNYAQILTPVTNLLRKGQPFHWGKTQQDAVNQIIALISSAPVLRHFDPSLPTRLHSDASQFAIGGWISQLHNDGWHPVVFVSRKLTFHEMNYSNPERELLAMVYSLEKQGHFLRCGIPVEVNIDCNSLEHIQTIDLTNKRLARWILLLQDYNLTLKYIKGGKNTVADYLSRNTAVAPTCGSCKKQLRLFQVSLTTSLLNDPAAALQYTTASDQDALLKEVLEWHQSSVEERKQATKSFLYKQFRKIGDKWFFGDRIYVPASEPLKLTVLKRYHDLAIAGHQGIRRTKTKLKEYYFWPQMDQDIERYISTCITCQRNADRNTNLPGLLHPLEVPTDRFKDISIDFANIPQHPDGWNQLMVVVCRLTKLVRLIPCKDSDRTDQSARRFLTGWFSCGFGLPATITSDRDTRFTSAMWTDLAAILGITLHTSTARHQQTNGQAEIAIRTYKRTARKYPKLLDPDEWETNLGLLEFALNNSINASSGFTPYYLAYGFKPRCFPEEYDKLASFHDKDTNTLLTTIERSLSQAQEAIRKSQDQHRDQYNRHRNPAPKYEEGDLVMLSSDGIRWPSEVSTPEAFKAKYIGPLRVNTVDHDLDNYQLDFPQSMLHGRFWPTFHVSHLKRYQSRAAAFPTWRDEYERPDPIAHSSTGSPLFAVDRILGHKVYGKNKFIFLIGFRGYPDSQNESQIFDPVNPYDWTDEWSLLQDYVANHPHLSIPILQGPCPSRSSVSSRRSTRTSLQPPVLPPTSSAVSQSPSLLPPSLTGLPRRVHFDDPPPSITNPSLPLHRRSTRINRNFLAPP